MRKRDTAWRRSIRRPARVLKIWGCEPSIELATKPTNSLRSLEPGLPWGPNSSARLLALSR